VASALVGLGETCGELILVVSGVRAPQVERLGVDSSHPLGLSLDGESDALDVPSLRRSAIARRIA